MDIIVKLNDFVNGIVWGVPLLVLIFFTGVFFTFRLDFLQFRHPVILVKKTVVAAFRKKDECVPAPGELSSFQAAMTSVSAIVGSGNIAGVATAIVMGGPGALFWMIVAAFFGMASKFAEIALGIKYREFNADGSVRGGAMYYIANGLGQKWLAMVFALLVIPFAFVISAVVDTNTIALTLYDHFNVPTAISGIVLAALVGLIVFGGVKKIGYVSSLVAPFMGAAYILSGLLVILINIQHVPAALAEIIRCAFAPTALAGGTVGSVFLCIKSGVARGMYSNEAGLGTAAMVHSGAKVRHPVEQAVWGPVEVFLDTVLVCSITALVIVLSGLWNTGIDGASLTVAAFQKMLPGEIGTIISLGAVVLFGFTCLISYYVYAEQAAEYIFGEKCKKIIKVLWVAAILIGSQSTLGFVWDLADTFNGLMIIPNLIAILLLSNEVVKMKNEYFEKLGD